MKRRDLLKSLPVLMGGALYLPPVDNTANAAAQMSPAPPFAKAIRGLAKKSGRLMQPIEIIVNVQRGNSKAVVMIDGVEVDRRSIQQGGETYTAFIEPVKAMRLAAVSLEAGGTLQNATLELKPVRKMVVYVLPHSHHDLGYTDLQADVEEKQIANIAKGIELARKTASYPEGSRFIWNLEVLWGADLYMKRRSPEEKAVFVEAVRNGWIALNGAYANELTGLCRPDELLQLFRFGTELGATCGTRVDSAMMSDVPGFSWGTVTAMAQAGIRYFSAAPNYFDRIGTFMETWQDKPFWWVSASGLEKVLVWVPWTGYAMSHVMKLGDDWVGKYQQRMDDVVFPYDISYVRWSGHGDNAEPDPELSEFVRSWNEKYEWPRFVISSTSTAFSTFEERYGSQLPHYKGDLTPYWEDGAGSSALETRMNRLAADRLTQAATLAAMNPSAIYRPAAYREAWRNVLLYSEHTWGAWCSVSDSENQFTKKQWEVKREFAVAAEKQSIALLGATLPVSNRQSDQSTIDVYNSTSWVRSELVLLSKDISSVGDRVEDIEGRPLPSQRLSTGELAVLVSEIAPFSSLRFYLLAKRAHPPANGVSCIDNVLRNDLLRVRIDTATGDITELNLSGNSDNLINRNDGGAANQYLFLEGTDLEHLGKSGKPTIVVEDHGPLVVGVRIESSAAGCHSLVRRLRLSAGSPYAEITNIVDKERAALNPNPGKGDPGSDFAQRGSKESVQFAFPLAVVGGQMTMDIPLAEMQPEMNQLPGSCKNWLPVGRWIDVSNPNVGVTWATLDAPLVEIGKISATMLGSQKNPSIWRQHIDPTQTFYSWVMNNHWGTNYRAYQEGPVEFRYALRPHREWNAAGASRFATGFSQPLIAISASPNSVALAPVLRVEPTDVLVMAMKPSDDGKATIVRLFGASGKTHMTKLSWSKPQGAMWLSDLAENQVSLIEGLIPVEGWGVMTIRVENS